MTIVDIETEMDPVRLHLGSSPIHLPEPVADLARLVAGKSQGPRDNRRADAIDLAVSGRSARPAHQHRPADTAIEQTRHPSRHRAQHRPVSARHRDPGGDPGPHSRHPHRRCRRMAATVRRRLDQLRRRDQPTPATVSRAFGSVPISDVTISHFRRHRASRRRRTRWAAGPLSGQRG